MLPLRLLVSATLALATALVVACWPAAPRPYARAFLPGPLGREPGPAEPVPAGRGFLTRAWSGLSSDDERAWGRANHLTEPLAFSHHLAALFPASLREAHPEYFPLVAGERLRPPPNRPDFWNPDLARPDVAVAAAAAARRHFTARPGDVSFALGVNDALIWGESPELLSLVAPTRWFRERPDYTAAVITFANRVAADLQATHPDRYVGTLAYYWAENAPAFPVHPRVIPFLTADRSQGYDPAFRAEERALQRRWAGAAPPAPGRRLGLYDYVYGHGFLVPRIWTRLLAEHLAHARGAGFTDHYAEVSPNWGLDGPMPWLLARQAADPSRDAAAGLDEYYHRHFGAAAAPMRRFFEAAEARWLGQPGPSYWLKHYRNESQAALFPAGVRRDLRALLAEAAAAAATARTRARVALVADAFGVTERFGAFHEARTTLLAGLLRGAAPETVRPALEDYRNTRREFVAYTDALRRTQPLAVRPFNWDDYLQNDPESAAQLALARADEATPVPAALARGAGTEHLANAAWEGVRAPARTIAGLPYGVALPAPWISQVEPAEHHRAGLEGGPDGSRLRVAGTKDLTVSQWVAAPGDGWYRAAVNLRGRVGPGTAVSLLFAWLDGRQRHLAFQRLRLPEGDWPDWVTLELAAPAPAGAAWIGVGVRVQNQVQDDWVEARAFSLRRAP